MASTTISYAMAGRVAELDLSGERPLVRVNEELLAGVASAVVEVNAHEVPVLVLRLVRFGVKGGTLPNGIRPEGAR
ncbi:hypothetical protein HDG32_002152 [Paraburkholderia sp. CI2]|uniref:hypothetical protein n=1 Tax=Paraburkholderia sp. CI2 TaxID=2723093 RepID=UPI0016149EF9|nr:hypothetical protein [Paraburkholderia sp. CI2]MBB5466045.1 hypothetical protein [Paraburkholderia sp. CI2]